MVVVPAKSRQEGKIRSVELLCPVGASEKKDGWYFTVRLISPLLRISISKATPSADRVSCARIVEAKISLEYK